jgi:dihydroorotate dehydrogenase (fumarate)
MVSALLRHGPERLREAKIELIRWMEKREYATLEPIRGALSLERCPNPAAFERGNYLHILQHWRGVCGRRDAGSETPFE